MMTDEVPRLHRDDLDGQSQAIESIGACVIEEALAPDQADELARRLTEQAAAEAALLAEQRQEEKAEDDPQRWVDDEEDPSQWVGFLPNKGACFVGLVTNPPVLNLARRMVGEGCILSEFSARITKPGSPAMALHSDQWWLPQPAMPGSASATPPAVADISRDQVGIDSPENALQPIAPRAVLTTLYALDEVTAEMGPTCVVPGSHLSGGIPSRKAQQIPDKLAPTLMKGDAISFDGRLWHGAGPNHSLRDRLTLLVLYVGPQFRQLTNYTLGLRPEVIATLSDEEKALFGFRIWNAYGTTDDYSATFATAGPQNRGPLAPDDTV